MNMPQTDISAGHSHYVKSLTTALATIALASLAACTMPRVRDTQEALQTQAEPQAQQAPVVQEAIRRQAPGPVSSPPATVNPDTAIPPTVPRESQADHLGYVPYVTNILRPNERPGWLKNCMADRNLDTVPRIDRLVTPDYPPELSEQDITGRVALVFEITPKGELGHVVAASDAHPELIRISIAAMKKWKFGVPRYKGQPVTACFTQRFSFVLE